MVIVCNTVINSIFEILINVAITYIYWLLHSSIKPLIAVRK